METITQPTELRYNLKCKILIKEVTYQDHQSKGVTNVTETLVYLIPQESTQRDLFYAAWLPDTREERFEIGFTVGHPINGFVRGCIKRRNETIKDHHIFIMSKGAEEDLKDYFCGKEHAYLNIEVLGEHEEELLDLAKNYALSNKKEFGNSFAPQEDAD
jgi:hypothetical protein